jgi:hypothetical protein
MQAGHHCLMQLRQTTERAWPFYIGFATGRPRDQRAPGQGRPQQCRPLSKTGSGLLNSSALDPAAADVRHGSDADIEATSRVVGFVPQTDTSAFWDNSGERKLSCRLLFDPRLNMGEGSPRSGHGVASLTDFVQNRGDRREVISESARYLLACGEASC